MIPIVPIVNNVKQAVLDDSGDDAETSLIHLLSSRQRCKFIEAIYIASKGSRPDRVTSSCACRDSSLCTIFFRRLLLDPHTYTYLKLHVEGYVLPCNLPRKQHSYNVISHAHCIMPGEERHMLPATRFITRAPERALHFQAAG